MIDYFTNIPIFTLHCNDTPLTSFAAIKSTYEYSSSRNHFIINFSLQEIASGYGQLG